MEGTGYTGGGRSIGGGNAAQSHEEQEATTTLRLEGQEGAVNGAQGLGTPVGARAMGEMQLLRQMEREWSSLSPTSISHQGL